MNLAAAAATAAIQGLNRVAAERDALRDGIRRLHFATAGTGVAGLPVSNCGGCSHSWPCPTIRLLGSDQSGSARG